MASVAPAMTSQSTNRSSVGREEDPDAPTRLQMIEYVSVRQWWVRGQAQFLFTLCLWVIFMVIFYRGTNAETVHEVQSALQNFGTHIVAHPSRGGVPPKTPDQVPAACRCACQSQQMGSPPGACGGHGPGASYTELIDFVGRVSVANAAKIGLVAGGVETAPSKSWDSVVSLADAWYWFEYGFLPSVWKPESSRNISAKVRPGLLFRRNLVIGGIRVRQRRAQLTTCQVNAGLVPFYQTVCRGAPKTNPFTPKANSTNLTSWLEASDDSGSVSSAFLPAASQAGAYDLGLDLSSSQDEVQRIAGELGRLQWLDESSRSLSVEALILNAEVGAYALMQANFVAPPEGGIQREMRVRVLQARDSEMFMKMPEFVPELLWILLILMLLRQEIWRLLLACYKRELKEYISDGWVWFDWIGMGVGIPVVFFSIEAARQVGRLNDQVLSLPFASADAAKKQRLLADRRSHLSGLIDTSVEMLDSKYWHQLALFWYASILTLRMIRCCPSQQKLATIQLALEHSTVDVCHYLMIFLTVFFNFVVGGNILFGGLLLEWSSFVRSVGTCVGMLLGNLEFEPMFALRPVQATIWFWMFLLGIVFLLCNLLLAIIVDHWTVVRKLVGATPTVFFDAWRGFKDLVWRCEWRFENFRDGEYKEALNNPIGGLLEEMLDQAEANDDLIRATKTSSLGCRLVRRRLETMSLEGVENDNSAGGRKLNGLDLRRMGVDPMTADFLLTQCKRFVASEQKKEMTPVEQVRALRNLIHEHRLVLDKLCDNIEQGFEEEKITLQQTLEELQQSVRVSLANFSELRATGADTLAPPLLPSQRHFQMELHKAPRLKDSEAYEQTTQMLRAVANAPDETLLPVGDELALPSEMSSSRQSDADDGVWE